MTNHSALAFERNALDLAVGLGASFYDEVDEARADLRAKLLVAMGRIEALRLARSPDEFEAAFDMLATPKLLVELIRLASDPALLLLARQGAARELAGKCLQAHDLISAELRDDVAERWTLLVRHLRSGAESELSQEESADEAVRAIRSLRRPVAEDIAAWFVSVIGLSLASHGRDAWDPWMTGLLWTFGRRAVVDAASACGIPWETATDVLTTARDRRLLAQGVDDASSGAAASLLNLH